MLYWNSTAVWGSFWDPLPAIYNGFTVEGVTILPPSRRSLLLLVRLVKISSLFWFLPLSIRYYIWFREYWFVSCKCLAEYTEQLPCRKWDVPSHLKISLFSCRDPSRSYIIQKIAAFNAADHGLFHKRLYLVLAHYCKRVFSWIPFLIIEREGQWYVS